MQKEITLQIGEAKITLPTETILKNFIATRWAWENEHDARP